MPFRGISAHLLIGEAREEWRRKISKAHKGKTHTCSVEARQRISASNLGGRNGMWKGDDVSYRGLHKWINGQLVKPELCERCGLRLAYDCANKSGEYKRDLSDWWWLCRHCHMELDGRMSNLTHNH